MIYKLTKSDNTYEIDDLVVFNKQPKAFREAYSASAVNDTAEFDNATVMVFESGRVIITEKGGNDE